MVRNIVCALVLFSALSQACGLHQSVGFNLTTEPGSLVVFDRVITARQNDTFKNQEKPDHFRLYSFKAVLAQTVGREERIDFALFEAIKGHYSLVELDAQVSVTGANDPLENDALMLVTELDVLDALATGEITWQQAKEAQWVVINGEEQAVMKLDDWFSTLFNSD